MMKKTLAILLALIMTASVALVSCNESDTTDDNNDDFVVDFEGGDINNATKEPETDENGETIHTSNNGSSNNNNNNNSGSSSSTMTQVNDTVYVLYKAKLRESAKETSKVLVDIPFATAVSRAEKNSKWSKVTYGGYTGYVMNDLVVVASRYNPAVAVSIVAAVCLVLFFVAAPFESS